jgi:hypothetical protein
MMLKVTEYYRRAGENGKRQSFSDVANIEDRAAVLTVE